MSLQQLLQGPAYPERIVCLTEEAVETLFRIGAGARVVGVSAYTKRPEEARALPRVSAFIDANFDKILALSPDLVIGFSDLQADIARELIKRGVPVWIQNQRSVAAIVQNIRVTGGLVGHVAEAEALAASLQARIHEVAAAGARLPMRPRVFFEEWPEPLISGIRWVSELVEIAGGHDVCAHTRSAQAAAGRIVTPAAVAAHAPDVVIASWCGKPVEHAAFGARAEWRDVPAVRNDQLYEVDSTLILQPGPAALTDGLAQLQAIVTAVATGAVLPGRTRRGMRRV